MPISTHEGKAWIEERVRRHRPQTVIDVGAGEGIYEMRMRCLSPGSVWTAIEVFDPYITRFGLREKYDFVLNQDVRTLSYPEVDLVVFGDVLEHMVKDDAIECLRSAQSSSRHVAVSVPIVRMEQGCVNGNDAESHMYHWGFHEMYDVIESGPGPYFLEATPGDTVGCYWWSKAPSDRPA